MMNYATVPFLCLVLAADWPQFRGPNGAGVSDGSALPTKFSPEKNVVWKTAVPPGHSSPILTETRIFMTAADHEKLLTLCLDRATGKTLWQREAPRPRKEEFQPTNSPASPSPVTDGRNVYVFFGDFGLIS
jgi:outer membrane protein assembly factor BamB